MSGHGSRRALIIGAGHNGLVAAYYLARAGFQVRMLERRGVVGGAAVTEEFHPGYRNSIASYTVSLLNREIIAELELERHGLKVIPRPIANFLPTTDERYLKIGGGMTRTLAEIARHSSRDAERYPAYRAALQRLVPLLRALAMRVPPRFDGKWHDLPALAWHAQRWLRLSGADRQLLLKLLTQSARAFLEQWFENDLVQAAFGFDSVVGNYASPEAPGSAYVLLHHVWGETAGESGSWGHPIGGMGSITEAMRRACVEQGVQIELDTPVAQVLLDGDRVRGVRTVAGQTYDAELVLANVNPTLLFSQLMPVHAATVEYRDSMRAYRNGSGTLRMNVALSELPDFGSLPGRECAEHHRSGIVIAPSLDYMDRAWLDARASGWSREPIVEMLIPSTVDDSLAPAGAHVASLFCQHFAWHLPDGRNWDTVREQVADQIVATVSRYAPNFGRAVIARQILTPLDLERVFGLVNGDIMHGQLALDQLWAARPVLGHGSYRTPIRGLYLCGAGAHPGGGVTGLPGRNCARLAARETAQLRD